MPTFQQLLALLQLCSSHPGLWRGGGGEKRKEAENQEEKEKAEDTSAALMFCLCDANSCCSVMSGHLPALPVCQEDLGSCVKPTQAMGREDVEATPSGPVGEILGLGALSMHHSFIHALTGSFPPLVPQ